MTLSRHYRGPSDPISTPSVPEETTSTNLMSDAVSASAPSSPTAASPRHVHPKLSINTTPRSGTPVGPRSPAIVSGSSAASADSDGSSASPDTENGPYLDRFQCQRVLGEGSYGKVKLAFDMIANRTVALKIIQKSTLKKASHITRLKREVRIMRLLHHPNITQLYDVIETEKEIVLVMEHVEGGELFDYIVAHKRLKEKIARRLFRQVISAVDYCHQSSVIHRDLKPENILLDTERNIKIIDFGFVKLYDREDMLKTFCGSPFYASPEMILGKQYIGPEVDIWSMGVILFALLNGHLPFRDANTTELYRKISHGVYETQTQYMTGSSADLIKRMLTVDPEKRATLEEVRHHPWVLDGYPEGPPESLVPKRPEKVDEPDQMILSKFPMYGLESSAGEEALKTGADSGPYYALYCLLKESQELMLGGVSPTSPTKPDDGFPEKHEDPNSPVSKAAALRRGSTTMRRPSLLSGRRESSADGRAPRDRSRDGVPPSPTIHSREQSVDKERRTAADDSDGAKLKRRASTGVQLAGSTPKLASPTVANLQQLEAPTRHLSLPRRGRATTDAGIISPRPLAGSETGTPQTGSANVLPSITPKPDRSLDRYETPTTPSAVRKRRQSALVISSISNSTNNTLKSTTDNLDNL
ncbi:hypothetical protein HK097_003346, partial [Rhizophlyctis rosea]